MAFVANFICFPAVQKFWKSVKIWQSYREFKGGNFFETQCSCWSKAKRTSIYRCNYTRWQLDDDDCSQTFTLHTDTTDTNFHFHFVNQFPLFMLTSIHPSVLHFPHPSPLHSFTLNSKLTSFVNHFPHRSLTIDTPDWLPRLMGPFSVFTVFVGVISCFWRGRQN